MRRTLPLLIALLIVGGGIAATRAGQWFNYDVFVGGQLGFFNKTAGGVIKGPHTAVTALQLTDGLGTNYLSALGASGGSGPALTSSASIGGLADLALTTGASGSGASGATAITAGTVNQFTVTPGFGTIGLPCPSPGFPTIVENAGPSNIVMFAGPSGANACTINHGAINTGFTVATTKSYACYPAGPSDWSCVGN